MLFRRNIRIIQRMQERKSDETHVAAMAREFDVAGEVSAVTPLSGGNINDTFLVACGEAGAAKRFILQQLNLTVFPSPEAVMHNMRVVTEHVHARSTAEGGLPGRDWRVPRLISACNGRDFVMNEEGECWRAITLIESATAHVDVQGPQHTHEAGYVLGQFQRLISDIAVEQLQDTLPGFHVMPEYLAGLDTVLAGEAGRERLAACDTAKELLDFVEKRREWCPVLEQAAARGELGLRPIHGDPKAGNIMVDDATGLGVGIIDLDTVKPGLVHYDFGDCLRSCCNPAGEEPDSVEQVAFDTDLCEEVVRGYMIGARGFLTEWDRHYLYDSIRLLAFELGVRFLADHLDGNRYFRVPQDGQNLHRAAVQLALCASIEANETSIRAILKRHW